MIGSDQDVTPGGSVANLCVSHGQGIQNSPYALTLPSIFFCRSLAVVNSDLYAVRHSGPHVLAFEFFDVRKSFPQMMHFAGRVRAAERTVSFSLRFLQRIAEGLERGEGSERTPLILFGKGTGLHLEALSQTGADALGLDWTCDLGEARRRVGNQVALQGNMDPTVLYAKPEAIRAEVGRILASYGKGSGHVFNLGHGITPEVNPEHAGAFLRAVHELSAQYHE